MQMRAKWAGRLCFLGLLILAIGIGVPVLAINLAGGGEMGMEYVLMTGMLIPMAIGVWVGIPLFLLGCVAWIVLKVKARKPSAN